VAYRVYWISAEDRRSAQASKVAAWYGSRQQNVTRRTGDTVQTEIIPEPVWGAFLRNASDLPVYDVHVRFEFPLTGIDDEIWNSRTFERQVLPPSDTPIHEKIDVGALRAYSGDREMDAQVRLVIEFTDSQGIRWHRDIKGCLKRVSQDSVRLSPYTYTYRS
jgi:hypothetical protein